MYIDILWRFGLELLMGKFCQFLTVICRHSSAFLFLDKNLSKYQLSFAKLGMCIDILWRSGLGLLMGKFHQFLTDLSSHHTIMMGYYCFMFLFLTHNYFFFTKYNYFDFLMLPTSCFLQYLTCNISLSLLNQVNIWI